MAGLRGPHRPGTLPPAGCCPGPPHHCKAGGKVVRGHRVGMAGRAHRPWFQAPWYPAHPGRGATPPQVLCSRGSLLVAVTGLLRKGSAAQGRTQCCPVVGPWAKDVGPRRWALMEEAGPAQGHQAFHPLCISGGSCRPTAMSEAEVLRPPGVEYVQWSPHLGPNAGLCCRQSSGKLGRVVGEGLADRWGGSSSFQL